MFHASMTPNLVNFERIDATRSIGKIKARKSPSQEVRQDEQNLKLSYQLWCSYFGVRPYNPVLSYFLSFFPNGARHASGLFDLQTCVDMIRGSNDIKNLDDNTVLSLNDLKAISGILRHFCLVRKVQVYNVDKCVKMQTQSENSLTS